MCDSKLVPLDQMILSYPRVEISKIEELKSFDLSGNLLSELIDIFKSEFKLNLPLMKQMLKNEDFEMLSKMSHRCQFRSASLGFSCPGKVWNFLNLDESATLGRHGSYYIQIGKIII